MFIRRFFGGLRWTVPPEILSALAHMSIGAFAGVIFLLPCLVGLRALDGVGGFTPVKVGPKISTPVPTPTKEEIFRERFEWDYRTKTVPSFGGGSGEVTIETSKKKKVDKDLIDERGIIHDSNGDGVLEFSIPVFEHEEPGMPVSYYTSFVHICCECALTHRVYIHFYVGVLGFRMYQRWEVLVKETHLNRVRQFGPRYWDTHPEIFSHEHSFGTGYYSGYYPEYQ
jgi:hypothetical protein